MTRKPKSNPNSRRNRRKTSQSTNPNNGYQLSRGVSYDRTSRFQRAISFTLPMYTGTTGGFGWNGAGTNTLQMYFSLQACHYDTGGSANTTNMPNYTEFTGLFDEWRIRHVDIDMYYSRNDHSGTSIDQLPIILSCVDYTDSLPLSVISDVLEYDPFEVRQLGNQRAEDPRCRFPLNPRLNITNNAGGTALSGDQWCNSIYPDVLWRGRKFWYNNTTIGAAALAGSITFIVTVDYEFRCPR